MTFKAHFDGKVVVLDEPAALARGQEVLVAVPAKRGRAKKHVTAAELLKGGFVGAWKDRTDIADSVAFARELRAKSNRPRYRL